MSTVELLFEGQTFQSARLFLVLSCKLFAKNMKLPKEPDEVRSEGHFWLSVAANGGVMTEIGMGNTSEKAS
jgi:hypothetical protein